jgi:hypothetical protein
MLNFFIHHLISVTWILYIVLIVYFSFSYS